MWGNISSQNLHTQKWPAIYLQRQTCTFFDCSSLKNCSRYYDPRPIHSEDKQPKRQRHWQHPAEVMGFVSPALWMGSESIAGNKTRFIPTPLVFGQ